ncbi:hypothetical protein LCGC14_2600720, partial [marine sediment metagenome]
MRKLLFSLILALPLGATYFFDGTNDRISYATATDFVITGDISFYMILKLDSSVRTNDLIVSAEAGAGETENDNSMFWLDIVGASDSWDLRYIHEYSAGTNEMNTFLTNITNDTFSAIGVVRDITANTVKLWKDGSLVDTFNYTNDPTIGATTTIPLFFGERLGGSFDGDYFGAEPALWDAAIPDDIMVMLTKSKLCPNFYRKDGVFHSHMIRNAEDIWKGHSPTITGAAVDTHAAVIFPTQPISGFAAAGAPPARDLMLISIAMKYAPLPLLAGGMGLA